MSTRPSADVATDLLAEVDATDLLSLWAATQCPLLIVSCSRVDEAPEGAPDWLPEMLAAYRAGLTRALREIAQHELLVTLDVFDGDHGLIWNQPEAVGKVVAEFLTTAVTS